MARTRNTLPATQNATAKNAPKEKRSREVDVEQPAPGKKAKTAVSKSKRQREVDDPPTVESEQGATKKTRVGKDPNVSEPRTPCAPARRSGRAHTTTLTAPPKRKRRTKEEIAADKAKAEQEKKRLEELALENHRAMVQMDVDEDIDRVETAARTIRTFGDLEDDSGEEFIGHAEVEDSESESDCKAEDALMLKETNKALQKELQALKAQLDGGKKKGKGGKKRSEKVTFASGLLPDWNSEGKEPTTKQTHVQVSAGGLDDSDAEAVNPFPPPLKPGLRTLTEGELTKGAQKAKRDLSRQNEASTFSDFLTKVPDTDSKLVSIVASDKEEEYVPHSAVRKAAVRIPLPVQAKAAKRKEKSAPVKTERSKDDSMPVKTAVAMKIKPKRLNGNNVRMSDLPKFAEGKWRSTFLPTLYDKFFASNQPFDTFTSGSDQFVALLQVVVEDAYPDIKYKVTSSDSIHFLAYNRVNEKRSNIGSNAVNLIKKHLSTLEGEQAPKDWLRWSLRVDGPLFFKAPSPMGSPIDQGNPAYQFPGGRLLSPFVISLAAPLLSLRAGSTSDNGYPKGLIALIMAALERAVRHLSKPSIKAKEFSKQFWGSQVGIYYNGFNGKNGVSETRWKELVEACLQHSEDSRNDTHDADLSILDNERAHVFNFCSPVKSRA